MVNKWDISCFGWYNITGVYCIYVYNVLTKNQEIYYIGSSKDIHKRINNNKHPYKILFNSLEYPLIVYVKYKKTDDYIELEKKLINKIKPILNKNGKKIY